MNPRWYPLAVPGPAAPPAPGMSAGALSLPEAELPAIDRSVLDDLQALQRPGKPDRVAKIDRTLPSNATYQVNGEITFDATGVTKAQIANWGPPIAKITVNADYAASNGEVK